MTTIVCFVVLYSVMRLRAQSDSVFPNYPLYTSGCWPKAGLCLRGFGLLPHPGKKSRLQKSERTRMKKLFTASAAALAIVAAVPVAAVEGMYTPEQFPELSKKLKKAGLKIKADQLSDLTDFPMGAVVSLGGCSASFVSPEGLVVTNHHCVRGSIQYNATEEHNYLEDGFLAADKTSEVPAAPGSRIYVTTGFSDVTAQVTGDIADDVDGRERYDLIDSRMKAITAECEKTEGYRCQVSEFFGGLEYKLIKRMEIKDVRLVYAPGDSIGKYGGDIDNWMWPRHTGDFGFYRAYVSPDGKPAEYSTDNVPYQPEHFLNVSVKGLEEGDFVMVAGYPGRTSRYKRLIEVEHTFNWFYPTTIALWEEWIDTIEAASPAGSDMRIKYESRLAGINNYLKNYGGQIDGARKVDLTGSRARREAALNAWVAADKSRDHFAAAIARTDAIAAENATLSQKEFWYEYATRPQLLAVAKDLYRLAKEHEKPDVERESGFQLRDETFIRNWLESIDRRYDPVVDKAEWILFLNHYLKAPVAQRVPALDKALGINATTTSAADLDLDRFYDNTVLSSVATRQSLMSATVEQLENMDDGFIQLAVALYDTNMAFENAVKGLEGESAAVRPDYMAAIINWQKAQGDVTYPDANSTLRISYGHVTGGSPQDGLEYLPFTTLEGITAKDTGMEPFNSPQRQLDLIDAKDYGSYRMKSLKSVPVNFLSDLDITGGNSGSATLNARGELVGLVFDGTLESVNSDWLFDPRTVRAIHVDSRYMLWVMEKVDNAQHLIDEMTVLQ